MNALAPPPLPRLLPGSGITPSARKVALRYIGPKSPKRDTLFGSGVLWTGPGDVQEVPANLLQHFLSYADLWALPEDPWSPPPPPRPADQDLFALVRAGRWDRIEALDLDLYTAAADWFGRRAIDLSPSPLPSAIGVPVATLPPMELVDAWVSLTLNGSEAKIREQLAEQRGLLERHQTLFDHLYEGEEQGRSRRVVLDLILSTRARHAAPPGALDLGEGAVAQ